MYVCNCKSSFIITVYIYACSYTYSPIAMYTAVYITVYIYACSPLVSVHTSAALPAPIYLQAVTLYVRLQANTLIQCLSTCNCKYFMCTQLQDLYPPFICVFLKCAFEGNTSAIVDMYLNDVLCISSLCCVVCIEIAD